MLAVALPWSFSLLSRARCPSCEWQRGKGKHEDTADEWQCWHALRHDYAVAQKKWVDDSLFRWNSPLFSLVPLLSLLSVLWSPNYAICFKIFTIQRALDSIEIQVGLTEPTRGAKFLNGFFYCQLSIFLLLRWSVCQWKCLQFLTCQRYI